MDHAEVTYESTGRKHPYHLVEPSPWPIVGALGAGLTAVGLAVFMHTGTYWLIILGSVLVSATMMVWWRDVVEEATFRGLHTRVVQIGLRYGMVLFIASEVMFFSAFFWAFFDASLFPKEAVGGIWPPEGMAVFRAFDIPFLNTLILLTSGVTVTWAHHAILEGHQRSAVQALVLTVLLGMTFTALQIFEYATAPFGFTDGVYASVFFMATGFHGFHVIVGTIFLAVCLFRAQAGHFKPDQHVGFEAAAWYWHFVDVVWLFLFICVYWWGNAGGVYH
jgi:cytochrome c oxidase subunit 3